MKDIVPTRSLLVFTTLALGASAATLASAVRYVRNEVYRRGYPSWEECRCDFKYQTTIFQVWNSLNRQRGETIVSEEWGMYLVRPAQWLRRLLHHGAQLIATLNPLQRYVERVTLSPQEAYLFAAMLHTSISNEDLTREPISDQTYVVWRREVLHVPRYLFDACIRRLYPARISPDRLSQTEALPALWDPATSLPLASDSCLLETPTGTRIDYIGWSPAQVSYCTARVTTRL